MNDYIVVEIAAKQQLTEDVTELTLVASDGGLLPAWQPGAHIELVLEVSAGAPNGMDDDIMLRHYSLCSDYLDRTHWKVAILREERGRGGSMFIHNQLSQGSTIKVSNPRNHFPFSPRKKCLFIAGGIGITPLLAMLQQADAENLDWQFIYLSRDRSRMSYLDVLAHYDQSRITLHSDIEDGFIDLPSLLATCDAETSIYSCGPKPLLDALELLDEQQISPTWCLDIERFAAAPVDLSGSAFDVVINSTGQRIHIPNGKSAIDVLREAGIKIPISCRDGVCGTCETHVLSGIPDHRDSVLTKEERAENDYMMLCVSRAISSELVLDL